MFITIKASRVKHPSYVCTYWYYMAPLVASARRRQSRRKSKSSGVQACPLDLTVSSKEGGMLGEEPKNVIKSSHNLPVRDRSHNELHCVGKEASEEHESPEGRKQEEDGPNNSLH